MIEIKTLRYVITVTSPITGANSCGDRSCSYLMACLERYLRNTAPLWKKVVKSSFTSVRCLCQSQIFNGVSRTGFDDYEKERASWNVIIPETFNFASDVLDVWAQKETLGQRTTSIPAFWFVYEDGREIKWSFGDLHRESKRVANALAKCGVGRGDNVMIMLPKIPEFWLINIAAMRIGCVLCAATTQLTMKDIAYRIDLFKPSCFIAHESISSLVSEAAQSSANAILKIQVSDKQTEKKNSEFCEFHELREAAEPYHECVKSNSDETMMVFFTSGTTGYPKMVEHTHSSYGIGHESVGKYMLDLTSENIMWNISDTGWAKTAYSNIFAPWRRGSCVFVHQMPRFNSKQTLETLCKYPIDSFCAPPMAYRTMVQEDLKSYKFNKLEHCITGGETLNPEVNRRWHAGTGLHIYEGYGQTESVILCGMFKCIKNKIGSMGKPSPGVNLAIIDENENEVAPGVEGEIAVKRTTDKIFGLFKGYKNEPELTKKRLTEKYFHTGDLGYYDEEGYFYFVGRKDDVINSAGYRIGPFEVESALMEHPAVVEVAVTSSPDEKRGQVVKAFIVIKKEYLNKTMNEDTRDAFIKELQEHTKQITAPYKYPRKIEFVMQLPKTISGKTKRFELRQKEWEKVK